MQRHNVIFKAVSGEQKAVTPEMTASWSEAYFPTTLWKYELKDIYNADEFGLFYQELPGKSLDYKDERCSGGTYSKVRLTRLAVGNVIGEKVTLFVIGKSPKPRCFSGVKIYIVAIILKKSAEWMGICLPNGWRNLTENLQLKTGRFFFSIHYLKSILRTL